MKTLGPARIPGQSTQELTAHVEWSVAGAGVTASCVLMGLASLPL